MLIWIVIIFSVIWMIRILSSHSNIFILLNKRISDVSTDSFGDSFCIYIITPIGGNQLMCFFL